MKYELVIQFSQDAMNFDEMVDLENILEQALKDHSRMDGHDIGFGQINYFILTDSPEDTFKQARLTIDKVSPAEYQAAYRQTTSQDYKILWPENLKNFVVE